MPAKMGRTPSKMWKISAKIGGYPLLAKEDAPQGEKDTPQDVEDTPPKDKGQKSKNDPRPGAVKSHLKTSRKWAVFGNLWGGGYGQSPEDVKDTPPVVSKG